jgi:hypothetical protein
LKPKLVTRPLAHPPHKCLVSKRADGELVDFGTDFQGANPHIFIRRSVIEDTARDLCGMRPETEFTELEDKLAATREELQRAEKIIAGHEQIAALEESVREEMAERVKADGFDPQEV